MKVLRPHQERALDLLRASLRAGKRRPMLKAPVGFGKTLVAANIARNAAAKGKRVAFIADAITLIDQTAEEFWKEGIHDLGVMQANHDMTDNRRMVQICSVQTISRRRMPQADIIMVDEAHGKSQWLLEWMGDPANAHIPVIGLSATPWSKGLGKHYDDLLVPASMRYLMDTINPDTGLGYLSAYEPYAPFTPDTKGIRTVQGDYDQGQASALMSQEGLVADIVQNWIAHGDGVPTIAFCHDRAHASKIRDRFVEAGIPWGYIDAYTEKPDRKAIQRQMETREIKGVASVGTLIKGVDWPIGCIIWACITKSPIKLVQGDGRGLRVNAGIGPCKFFDHAGNHKRLGYPEDIDEAMDRLCMKEPGEKSDTQDDEKPVPKPKECPKCKRLKPIGMRSCPACGFTPEIVSAIEEQEGRLVLDPRKVKQDVFPLIERQAWLSSFNQIAEAKGYKPGWASEKYREKWGGYPEAMLNRTSKEKPTEAVTKWLQSQNIRRAKGKQRNPA